MSLFTDSLEPCVMLHKTTQNDGYGGEIVTWVRGASFEATVTFDSSVQARIGLAQGVRNMYTVYTRRSKTLEPFEVFERESDHKTFRVTSDGKDKKTPPSAATDMRVVTAEEFEVPYGG